MFEPSVDGGLTDLLENIITDIYTAASLPPRISVSRHGNYQVTSHTLSCPDCCERLRNEGLNLNLTVSA